MRRGHVIGVAGKAVADHFGVDLRAARLRMLVFLEHHHPRALAHHEAVAGFVVRPAGFRGFVVEVGAERACLREPRDADRADRAFRAPREHDVGIVVADHPRGIADRMRARRAGGDHRMVRAHQAVLDRDLAGDQVDQPPVHEVRADASRAALVQYDRFRFDARQPADARADRTARTKPGLFVHLRQPGILDRLAGGIDAEHDERIDLALDLVIDPLVRIEPIRVIGRLHLAGDATLLVRRVELGYRPRPALAGKDVRPRGLDVTAQRGDEAETGYDHTAHTHSPQSPKAQPDAAEPSIPCHVRRDLSRREAANPLGF